MPPARRFSNRATAAILSALAGQTILDGQCGYRMLALAAIDGLPLSARGFMLESELLVRADDSPLRMNGSGLLILNPPWQLDQTLAGVLPLLAKVLGEGTQAESRLEWLVRAA